MALSDRETRNLVEAVRDAAAQEIMPRFRQLAAEDVHTKSGPRDLVTAADCAAETRIGHAVARILPDAVMVGEEAIAKRPELEAAIGSAERCVVVDPVDGTSNFVAGLTLFGVILAVVERGKTVYGLLYDPVIDDWVEAVSGGGAYHFTPDGSERKLAVRAPRPLDQSRGFLRLQELGRTERDALMTDAGHSFEVRDLACSCHEYRTLVFGQADFLAARTPRPWDHAAGILALQEAGGWARLGNGLDYMPNTSAEVLYAATCGDLGEKIERFFSKQ